jgi:hypothetical protein
MTQISWPTNSTLVYESNAGEWGLVVGRGVSSRDMDEAQINFGDLTPYLTYGANVFCFLSSLPLLPPATGSYLSSLYS